MSLYPGQRIGNFEVLGPLGAGGMGEVYRARDTRLDRTVAIKALPEGFAGNPERLSRFEREAKLLAALHHPNIAGIHGIEDGENDGPYLVLEFVEGETLVERLARGSFSVRDTLRIGEQIASAIDAAHERGVIHRDLKPGNIMLTGADQVKVLDFGLAKGEPAPDSSSSLTASPTLATPATADGIILGTAPYMSPEQARGRPVDKRGDVWAFGCVLLECLSGRPPFRGETVSDVIAQILEREPDWEQFPPGTPPRLAQLIRRCLTKDAHHRPRDIGDLGRELVSIAAELDRKPARGAADDRTPSLAVLYFENLARDPDSEYFCSGITEDILTDLSKIKGLRVASKNAVQRYRGEEVELAEIARDLGVKTILEGSVRRAGDRIRITTQLINAADGFQLWAERFDRTLDDVFAVQDEIAGAIVEALRVAMTPSDAKRIAKERPKDAQAYDLYLKGREQYGRYREDAMQDALDLFQQAIDIDPGYARAWAGRADALGQMVQHGWAKDTEENGRLGLEAARKAISLDPKLAEAYKAEALVLRHLGDGEGTIRALRQAIEADPRFTPALINLAVEQVSRGDLAAGERLIRRVVDIDPQEAFGWLWLAGLLIWTSRDSESLEAAERIPKVAQGSFYVLGAMVARILVFIRRGDTDRVEETIRESRTRIGADRSLAAAEAVLAAYRNRPEEARRLLEPLRGKPMGNPNLTTCATVAALKIGDLELAAGFARTQSAQDMQRVLVRLHPEMHPILDHPAFRPRKLPLTLVWPIQAPMIDATRFELFQAVHLGNGRPEGSSLLSDTGNH